MTVNVGDKKTGVKRVVKIVKDEGYEDYEDDSYIDDERTPFWVIGFGIMGFVMVCLEVVR